MWNRPAGKVQPKTQVLLGWRIGDEHQTRHARLENEPIAAVQPQHDALSEPAYFLDPPSLNSAGHSGAGGLNENRPAAAANAASADNAAVGDARNSTAHRFDFRKL